MKKRLICLILLLPLLFVGQVGADQVQEQPTDLVVDGEDAIVDIKNQIVEFIGNVVVWYEDLHMSGDLLQYQEAVRLLKIEGNVQFEGQDLKGKAQMIQMDINEDVLTMSGEVEIIRDGQVIRGNTVIYNLETGVLRVQKAHLKIQNFDG